MKFKIALGIFVFLFLMVGFLFVNLILPKMQEKDKSNSELYFKKANFFFKAKILEHHQLNAYTAGVLKLKLIKGEINTHKNYIHNITTGTFNPKDSILYVFATFYPEVIRKIDLGIKPTMIEMNSKLRETKIFNDPEDFFKTKIYFYGDTSFKKRAFRKFLKEHSVSNNLFW